MLQSPVLCPCNTSMLHRPCNFDSHYNSDFKKNNNELFSIPAEASRYQGTSILDLLFSSPISKCKKSFNIYYTIYILYEDLYNTICTQQQVMYCVLSLDTLTQIGITFISFGDWSRALDTVQAMEARVVKASWFQILQVQSIPNTVRLLF